MSGIDDLRAQLANRDATRPRVHVPNDAPYRVTGPTVREGDRIAYEDLDGNRIEGYAHFNEDGSITIDETSRPIELTKPALVLDRPSDMAVTLRRWLPGDATPAPETLAAEADSPELKAIELWSNPLLPPHEELTPRQAVMRALFARLRELGVLPIWNLPDDPFGIDEPAPRSDGKPPVPKPSHTPPMWANNPGRTKRKRNRASDVRTPKS